MKRGKKYLEAASKIEKGKAYDIEEAVSLLKETKVAKFDESVELCSKEVIELNKEIDSAFLICEFKEYDRLLNIKTSDGIYYVIEFKLAKDKKVTSIGFSVAPYLP